VSRLVAAVLACVVLLGAAAPGAGAQDATPPDPTRTGPGALWDAYPLDGRPRPADGAGEAAVSPSARATGDRVAFRRQEPDTTPALTVIAALCLGAGLVLCAAGLLLARGGGRRRAWPAARGGARTPSSWP